MIGILLMVKVSYYSLVHGADLICHLFDKWQPLSMMHIIILALESTVHGITIHWQHIIGIHILLIIKVSYDNLVHGADWTRDLFNKCWY